jgi:hypothetical protein
MELRWVAVAVAPGLLTAHRTLQEGAGQHEADLRDLLRYAALLCALCSRRSHVPSVASGIPPLRHGTQYIYRVPIGPDEQVTAAISGFSPYTVPAGAAAFARRVVAEAHPESPQRARALLWATSKLAEFCIGCGLELEAEVAFHPSVIERFCGPGATRFSGPARRTLRGHLRFMRKRVLGEVSPVVLSREHAKAPYSKREIDSYLALADAQPTLARRMHAVGLICLGAGAGLMGSDLRCLRGRDVKRRFGGVVVLVGGRNPRNVPVIQRYHERLLESAGFTGDGYLIGGELKDRKNVTTPLIRSLAGGVGLERLSTYRLRSTWLCECATAIGLKAFMDAAGLVCSQRLGDLVGHLPAGDERRAVEILGQL